MFDPERVEAAGLSAPLKARKKRVCELSGIGDRGVMFRKGPVQGRIPRGRWVPCQGRGEF